MEPAAERVTDPGDPRVAEFVGLTDADLRRGIEGHGGRNGRGLFIVEGTLAIGVLLGGGGDDRWSVRSVLVTEKKRREIDEAALARRGARLLIADQRVLDAVVGFNLHRGAVASVDRPDPTDTVELIGRSRQAVVLEGINDQENMGVIFRNAAALGADAVLLSPTCCDPLYRRTVRVSMGHVLRVPFATLEAWPAGLTGLRTAGFRLLALTPNPAAASIDDVAPGTGGRRDRIALMLGSEGPGLTEAAMGGADERVRIPMRTGVDSLNVATAAAIALHRLFEVPT